MFKKITNHIELGAWTEPIFGVGLTFTSRGFHILLGPVNLDFHIYTNSDLERRERMLSTWLSGITLEDDEEEDDL